MAKSFINNNYNINVYITCISKVTMPTQFETKYNAYGLSYTSKRLQPLRASSRLMCCREAG